MTEFKPEEIAENIFEEINVYIPKVTDFLSQERFSKLTPLIAVEMCEKEIPPPAKHLSLGVLLSYHPEGLGVTVDSNVTEMLLNAGIEEQETYLRSEKLAKEIYQMLMRQGFKLKLFPRFSQAIAAHQLNDPSRENPPPDASYKNGVEVYMLSNYFYSNDQSRKVTLSKKINVELDKSIF